MTGQAHSSSRASASAPVRNPGRRTRVVAWVVVGLLVLHVVAVAAVLSVAKWAAADTEQRLAGLQWAFPSVEIVAQVAPQPLFTAAQAPTTADWLSRARSKDTAAPWSVDRSGHVVWK
jgi:hypothetical protein